MVLFKTFFFQMIGLLIGLFILTLFNYYNLLSDQIYSLGKLFFLLGSIFIASFFIGKKTSKHGYQIGFYYGMVFIGLLFLVTLFSYHLEIRHILYYLLILSSSVLGSMFGRSQKKD